MYQYAAMMKVYFRNKNEFRLEVQITKLSNQE